MHTIGLPVPSKNKKRKEEGKKENHDPHRKVRVLGEAAHPLPSLQTIPTVFCKLVHVSDSQCHAATLLNQHMHRALFKIKNEI